MTTIHNLDSLPRNSRFHRSLGALALAGLLTGTLLTGALVPPAKASTIVPYTFSQRIERAELIVEGTVSAIDHRNSSIVEPGDVELPHTFVTFSIHQVVKGQYEGGDSITLRFLGGPDGRGGIVRASGLPSFQLGDREILFIRDNGELICPLVGWGQGRLRVIRDAVYDDAGFRVWITPDGQLGRGSERVDLREETYPLLGGAQPASQPQKTGLPAGSTTPNRQAMLAAIGQLDAAQGERNPRTPEPVQSASPRDRFRAPSFLRRPSATAGPAAARGAGK